MSISNRWHVVPVSNHLTYTESEFAPWDPSKAHILVSTPDLVSIFGRLKFERDCINHTPPKSKTVCVTIVFSLYIWSNQLYEQSGRTLPADSGLRINWLLPSKKLSQVCGKAEIQLALIFQRWDFENAFHDFDGSDRTSPKGQVGLAGHQGPKPSYEQPVPTFPRTFTWLLQCTQSCLNGSNTHFSRRLPERAFWEIQCLQHATLSPPTSCILYSSLATLEEAIQSILRLLNVLRSETNFNTEI